MENTVLESERRENYVLVGALYRIGNRWKRGYRGGYSATYQQTLKPDG